MHRDSDESGERDGDLTVGRQVGKIERFQTKKPKIHFEFSAFLFVILSEAKNLNLDNSTQKTPHILPWILNEEFGDNYFE